MDFTTQIAKILIKDGLINNRSVVCSPASIDAVLRILAVGAKNSTLEELLRSLGHANLEELNTAARELAGVLKGSEDEDRDGPVISYVNALWLDQRFSLDNLFHKVLRDVHNAEARAVDFKNQADEVVKEVNSWAKEQTKGLIKQVLTRESIGNDTVLLLANALYFKGTWEHKFYKKNTKVDEFNLLNGDKIQVPFMNQSYKHFNYGMFEECQVLKMPYRSATYVPQKWDRGSRHITTEFSMYIFLPNDINGLPNLMENIKIDQNMFNDGRFKLDRVKLKRISIPIFNLVSDLRLKGTMKQLGLTLPFEAMNKDFSGIIDGSDPLYVNDVVHRCRVETNEHGTEAVGYSAYDVAYGCTPIVEEPPKIIFLADHPFMFMIREDFSGAILFIGSMLNPK
ncbi:serpin-ZX-like [Silene latifolia]|uniref:serpin-ZX-like n=1 Tax=Silene latifolia TaxID=37657 RepID=UPI003D775909